MTTSSEPATPETRKRRSLVETLAAAIDTVREDLDAGRHLPVITLDGLDRHLGGSFAPPRIPPADLPEILPGPLPEPGEFLKQLVSIDPRL